MAFSFLASSPEERPIATCIVFSISLEVLGGVIGASGRCPEVGYEVSGGLAVGSIRVESYCSFGVFFIG